MLLKINIITSTGQHIVEEILDAQRPACPPEYFNIKIPNNHHYRTKLGHSEMPVLRTRYDKRTGHNPNNPRQQVLKFNLICNIRFNIKRNIYIILK